MAVPIAIEVVGYPKSSGRRCMRRFLVLLIPEPASV